MEKTINAKLPIFIGGRATEIFKEIEEFIKVKSTNLELVVINPDTQMHLEDAYLLNSLDEQQRKEAIERRSDLDTKKNAKDAAISLSSILSSELETDDFFVTESFTKAEARRLIIKYKGNVSNKQIDELFEFLAEHEQIMPSKIHNGKSHLTEWKFSFTNEQRIVILNDLIQMQEWQISQLQKDVAIYHKKIDMYQNEIDAVNGSKVDTITVDDIEEKPKKKRGRPKKTMPHINIPDIKPVQSVSAEDIEEMNQDEHSRMKNNKII